MSIKALIVQRQNNACVALTSTGQVLSVNLQMHGTAVKLNLPNRIRLLRDYTVHYMCVVAMTSTHCHLQNRLLALTIESCRIANLEEPGWVAMYQDSSGWLFGIRGREAGLIPNQPESTLQNKCRVPLLSLQSEYLLGLVAEESILKLAAVYPVCQKFKHSPFAWVTALFTGLIEHCMRVNVSSKRLQRVTQQLESFTQFKPLFEFLLSAKDDCLFGLRDLHKSLRLLTPQFYSCLEAFLVNTAEGFDEYKLIHAFCRIFDVEIVVLDMIRHCSHIFSKTNSVTLKVIQLTGAIYLLYSYEECYLDKFNLTTLTFAKSSSDRSIYGETQDKLAALKQLKTAVSSHAHSFFQLRDLQVYMQQCLNSINGVLGKRQERSLYERCRACLKNKTLLHQCGNLLCIYCMHVSVQQLDYTALFILRTVEVTCPHCSAALSLQQVAQIVCGQTSQRSHHRRSDIAITKKDPRNQTLYNAVSFQLVKQLSLKTPVQTIPPFFSACMRCKDRSGLCSPLIECMHFFCGSCLNVIESTPGKRCPECDRTSETQLEEFTIEQCQKCWNTFNSRETKRLRCGHVLCLSELISHNRPDCPICGKYALENWVDRCNFCEAEVVTQHGHYNVCTHFFCVDCVRSAHLFECSICKAALISYTTRVRIKSSQCSVCRHFNQAHSPSIVCGNCGNVYLYIHPDY